MASTISAGTTSGTAIAIAGDTSGQLQLQTNGTTTAVTIDTSQNVGIGTASPAQKLDVIGNVRVGGTTGQFFINASSTSQYPGLFFQSAGTSRASIFMDDSGATYPVYVSVNTTAPLIFRTDATERMRIGSDGKTAIGTATTTGGRLTVKQATDSYADCFNLISDTASGSIAWQLLSDGGSQRLYFARGGGGKGYIDGTTGAYVSISDSRVKKNVVDLNYGLSEILKLRPVKYNINIEEDTAKTHIGLIAQEVKTVIDEAVDDLPNTEDMYGLDKSGLVPILIKAIQELNAKVDAQALEIQALKGAA
jgi:hypothetical protein